MTGWSAGDEPWIRRQSRLGAGSATDNGGGAQCYFCGENTLKRSFGDLSADAGRVGVYCDNSDCDAREITVVVDRDGAGAGSRADVRTLQYLEGLRTTLTGRGLPVMTVAQLEAAVPPDSERLAARTRQERFTLQVD